VISTKRAGETTGGVETNRRVREVNQDVATRMLTSQKILQYSDVELAERPEAARRKKGRLL
jgi:hypothetical protein